MVRDRECWLHEVKSLDLTWDDRWTRSEESIRFARARLKAANPGEALNEAQEMELWPESKGTLRIALDERRIAVDTVRAGFSHERNTWDGRRAIARSTYPSFQQDDATIRPTFVGDWFRSEIHQLRLVRGMFHSFWWLPPDGPNAETRYQLPDAPAESYVVTARCAFRGVDCWVVHSTANDFARRYIGVADGHLRGVAYVEHVDSTGPQAREAAVAVARARGATSRASTSFPRG